MYFWTRYVLKIDFISSFRLIMEHFRFSIQKMLDKDVNVKVLYTILSNIKYSDLDKYKTVKSRKLDQHTRDILELIGFKRTVELFEEYHVYQDSLEQYLDVVLSELEKKKKNELRIQDHQKTVLEQIKKDKEASEKIHDTLMMERAQRRKNNGWLT